MRKPVTFAMAIIGLMLLFFQIPRVVRSQGEQPPMQVQKEDCYGFELNKLRVNHQGKNILHLSILYRYAPGLKTADYMDVNEIRKAVLDDVQHYPNTTDYWEVYSSRLADRLYAHYTNQLDALRLKLEIAPDSGAEPFPRTSLVIRSRPGSPPLIP